MADAILPETYAQAAAHLQTQLRIAPLTVEGQTEQQTLANAEVNASKGFTHMNWKAGASEDRLQFTISDPSFGDSNIAEAVSKAFAEILNKIHAVRDAVIMVSPKEYFEQQRNEVIELQQKAREANIPGSKDLDFEKMDLLDASLSRNQLRKYATEITDGAHSTDIRIQIPTNPENRDAAAAVAARVEEHLKSRLPELKEQMIARIIEKKLIPDLTPEKIEHLRNHTLDITTNQQANWTSVFLSIRSPEQQEEHDKPGTHKDMEALKKSNMLMQIPDDKSRSKLAARTIMYEGEMLRKPASYFLDVAGTEDIKNTFGKVLNRLSAQSPEDVQAKIKTLLNENFLKSVEQWNLPPEQQEIPKHPFSAEIDPEKPGVLKFTLPVAKGKAHEIIGKIAALAAPQQAADAADPKMPVAGQAEGHMPSNSMGVMQSPADPVLLKMFNTVDSPAKPARGAA